MQSFSLQGTYQFNHIVTTWASLYNFLFANDNSQDCSAVIQTRVIGLKILCFSYHTFWRVPERKFSGTFPSHVPPFCEQTLVLEHTLSLEADGAQTSTVPSTGALEKVTCVSISPRPDSGHIQPRGTSLPTPTPQQPPSFQGAGNRVWISRPGGRPPKCSLFQFKETAALPHASLKTSLLS